MRGREESWIGWVGRVRSRILLPERVADLQVNVLKTTPRCASCQEEIKRCKLVQMANVTGIIRPRRPGAGGYMMGRLSLVMPIFACLVCLAAMSPRAVA